MAVPRYSSLLIGSLLVMLAWPTPAPAAAKLISYAQVRADATLLVGSRVVRLFGIYLIERGWAVAAPGGPFQYRVLENIARERNMGVWGFHGVVVSSRPAAP